MQNLEKFEEENPEITNYVKCKVQEAVQLICSVLESQYNSQLASYESQLRNLQQRCLELESDLWSSSCS